MAEKIAHKIYNETIEISFYPNSHRYRLETKDGEKVGSWLKSPSSILSKLDKSGALVPWAVGCFYNKMIELMDNGANFTPDDLKSMLAVAKKAHTEKKDAAANAGSVVHDYIEAHNTDPTTKIEDIDGYEELEEVDKEKVHKALQGYEKWFESVVKNMIEAEFIVYSKSENFVGTCDAIVKTHDGRQMIVDYKTSKGIYTSHIMQVSAYLKAYEEEHDVKLDGALLVHFVKEDIEDKEGNIIQEAGTHGVLELSRSDIVKAYKTFKALHVVAKEEPKIYKLIKENYVS